MTMLPGLQKTMNHSFIILTYVIHSAGNSYLESWLVSAVLVNAKSRVLVLMQVME